MGTVIQYTHRGNDERNQRWDRVERAELFAQYGDLQAQGLSRVKPPRRLRCPAARCRHGGRIKTVSTNIPPWWPFSTVPQGWPSCIVWCSGYTWCVRKSGRVAFAWCVCWCNSQALIALSAASYGAQHQVNRQVEEAIVAYRREESTRWAKDMPTKDLTLAQDETFTGGLCLVAMDPKSNYILLEQAAPARDHDTWHALMAQALSGLNCHIIQSTSDEAPGSAGVC